MATTDGTLIAQQLDEVTQNLVSATTHKNEIIRTLAEYGAPVAEGDPMATINPALQSLLASMEKGEATTTVTFVVNPTGGNGYIPDDATVLAAAVEGAYIQIEEIGTQNTWVAPRTGGANRNPGARGKPPTPPRRPPHGGRE